jgi:SAM-dependent methyltransferase
MTERAMNRIVTGAEYVTQITALESDRQARAAFWDLVAKIAPPRAALLDFGAGTGMDARFYVERGFAVTAYDVDPEMRAYFASHCEDLMAAGRVTLENGSYRDFLDRRRTDRAGSIDLVTSNFAPFNLVDNLHELFAAFYARTGPTGKVLASVLSPYFLGDAKYGWWWRNAPRLWRDGRFSVVGAQVPIVRRRLSDFFAQCSPYFRLARVIPGLPSRPAQSDTGIPGEPVSHYSWMRLLSCRFMFLLFEKSDSAAAGHTIAITTTPPN